MCEQVSKIALETKQCTLQTIYALKNGKYASYCSFYSNVYYKKSDVKLYACMRTLPNFYDTYERCDVCGLRLSSCVPTFICKLHADKVPSTDNEKVSQ